MRHGLTQRKRLAARIALVLVGFAVVLVVGGLGRWTATALHADAVALAATADDDGPDDGVVVRQLTDGSVAFVAHEPVAGMVFYPGGNVEPEAYAPLLTLCARAGVTAVLVRPPLRFALLDIDAASDAMAEFPDIDRWLLAGHSLGGVAACEHLAQHADSYDAIVLLASFPNADLRAYTGTVLQLVGTEDGILSRGAYDEARELLPEGAREQAIEGGNHAQFGNYGEQKGDGAARISREEQQTETAAAIANLARE